MRRDATLLARLEEAPSHDAVLRLFAFHPPGITLGHAQRPESVLDLDRCRAEGIAWVARPTGGRAIFHAREWTYALAARIDDPEWGGSLAEAYARASRLIHGALARLGVPAALASRPGGAEARAEAAARGEPAAAVGGSKPRVWPPEGRAAGGAPSDERSAACFASTARHEIVLEGRKLVGSAQRRTRDALLQQGSILLDDGHLRLADFLAAGADERERARSALASAAHAGAFLGEQAPLTDLAAAIELELGGRARRYDGPSGGFLLTSSKTAPYTRPFTQSSC